MREIMSKVLITFVVVMMASNIFAASLETEALMKGYKLGVKSCRQIGQDHEAMKGQHEMMLGAWQEKSSSLLSEDKEVLEKCNDLVLTLKQTLEGTENRAETLKVDDENIQDVIKALVSRHRGLKEKHERIFHEMMGH